MGKVFPGAGFSEGSRDGEKRALARIEIAVTPILTEYTQVGLYVYK